MINTADPATMTDEEIVAEVRSHLASKRSETLVGLWNRRDDYLQLLRYNGARPGSSAPGYLDDERREAIEERVRELREAIATLEDELTERSARITALQREYQRRHARSDATSSQSKSTRATRRQLGLDL